MKRSMILMFILIAVAIYFLISRTSTPSPEASGGSCGCNKGKDPVYLDDQQVILDQPSAYSEFAQTGNSLLV